MYFRGVHLLPHFLRGTAMPRYTRATIAATALGWDAAEMADARYQPTRFYNVPVWSAGDGFITVATSAELARMDQRGGGAEGWNWELHPDHYAQGLAQTMNPRRLVWITRAHS
jgi:hypothetical protein